MDTFFVLPQNPGWGLQSKSKCFWNSPDIFFFPVYGFKAFSLLTGLK